MGQVNETAGLPVKISRCTDGFGDREACELCHGKSQIFSVAFNAMQDDGWNVLFLCQSCVVDIPGSEMVLLASLT